MRSKVEHTTVRNKKLFCLHCGGEFDLHYPFPVNELIKKTKSFNSLHQDCKPMWKQPEVDQSKSVQDKMTFWLGQGERGISSETMFEVISGQITNRIPKRHPCDPDDFRRCYLLLKTIPEWKDELHKLRGLSPVWGKLVDNWDKLTELLEEQLKTKKPNGMYLLMKSLGC